MKKIKRNWIYDLCSALILTILGIIFICIPNAFGETLAIVLGSIAIVFGVGIIIFSLIMPNLFSLSLFSILIGGMTLMVGIVLLSSGDALTKLVPIVFALYLIVNGISKITESVDLNKLNLKLWIPTLVFGLVYVAGGIVMLFFINQVAEHVSLIVGILLILLSISYLFDMFIKIKAKKTISTVEKTIIKDLGIKPNETVVDAEFVEKEDDK